MKKSNDMIERERWLRVNLGKLRSVAEAIQDLQKTADEHLDAARWHWHRANESGEESVDADLLFKQCHDAHHQVHGLTPALHGVLIVPQEACPEHAPY